MAINVYYNETTSEIYIDKGSQSTTISLPRDISSTEVAYMIHSDTLTAVIEQLTE